MSSLVRPRLSTNALGAVENWSAVSRVANRCNHITVTHCVHLLQRHLCFTIQKNEPGDFSPWNICCALMISSEKWWVAFAMSHGFLQQPLFACLITRLLLCFPKNNNFKNHWNFVSCVLAFVKMNTWGSGRNREHHWVTTMGLLACKRNPSVTVKAFIFLFLVLRDLSIIRV